MLFASDIKIPRMRQGKKQALETLINEKVLLLAKYPRKEGANWIPRLKPKSNGQRKARILAIPKRI